MEKRDSRGGEASPNPTTAQVAANEGELMTVSPKQGLYKKWTLTDAELAEVKQLAQICQADQPLDLRLTWDALALRTGDKVNDLLYYRDDTLVGFFSTEGLGFEEA